MKKLNHFICKSFAYWLFCGFLCLVSTSAFAEAVSIPVQGFITDTDGNPLTGTHTVVTNLYNSCDDATPAQTESADLVFHDGFYSTSIEVTWQTALANTNLCIGIAIDADDELTPRMEYFATPYAKVAEYAPNADHANVADALAEGDIGVTGNLELSGDLSVGATTISPAEWANLDGATGNLQAQINALAAGGGSGDITDVIAGNGLIGGATTGAATLNIGTGSGITVAADNIALGNFTADWMQTGAFDLVLGNAASELKIMESAGATFYGTLDVTDLNANRTYTLPDVSGTIALTSGSVASLSNDPGDCLANQVATAIAANGDLSCSSVVNGMIANDAVTLGTQTTGNYVASVGTSLGLTGGAAGSEGAALTLGIDYSLTLAGNPALQIGQTAFDATEGGLIFEGSAADTNEGALKAGALTADRTWTLPDADGTFAISNNGTNCGAGNYALGVAANGDAEGCTADDDQPDADNEVPDNITIDTDKVIRTVRANLVGGSNTGILIQPTLGAMDDGADTYVGMDMSVTNANHTGGNVLGLRINPLINGQDAQAKEVAIELGNGWDTGITMGTNSAVFTETGGGSDTAVLIAPSNVNGNQTITLPSNGGQLALTVNPPAGPVNITAVGQQINSYIGALPITADNSYTLSSTPTVPDGAGGQMMIIINEDAADVITLQDQGQLAGSNLRLGAATRVLGPRDNITLMFDSNIGDWIETSFVNVQ